MASTLQLAIEGIQLSDYATRMLVDLCASRPLTLLFFLVVILTAVGYDYSKLYVLLCASSGRTSMFSVLTFPNEVCPHSSAQLIGMSVVDDLCR